MENKKRYICLDDAITKLEKDKKTINQAMGLSHPQLARLICKLLQDTIDWLMKRPVVEIEKSNEPKTGQIIETIKNGKMHRVFSCCDTECTQLTSWIHPKHCPECGAKLDKEIVKGWKKEAGASE